ncbi:acyl-CoA thioesterase [Devosia sediminis]|uniref:Acyl-CoA thioesterase n=1 Tax=Devosia sediminis TaxID=2798801 RepID=A0A934MS54_9HYPH|nr:thioesterase family protein [Devosia sediminis]MBJ3786094.1 acyl-CoA thioesterase [Devosia sediminis]
MYSRTTAVEIQFGDCDPAGIVYYPNYFRFFDNATAGLLSAVFAMHKRNWLEHYGILGIPMVDTGARFIRPSSFGDVVEIRSEIAELGRSSFGVKHSLLRDGELAIEAHEKRVWVVKGEDGGIRSAPLPDEVRRLLGQDA